MCKLIAVYGTLRRGGPANGYLRGAKYVGEDRIPARLHDLGWFPGVRFDEEAETTVDVYELPNDVEALSLMDHYEGYHPNGHPKESLFVRKKTLLKERNEEVYFYEYNTEIEPDSRRILSGDWFKKEET